MDVRKHVEKLFFENGRPAFTEKGCVILCQVTYSYQGMISEETFWQRSLALGGKHAEIMVLYHIMTQELRGTGSAVKIAMYSSYSPCAACATQIKRFLDSRPMECKFFLRFACVYMAQDSETQRGLRELNGCGAVKELGVFNFRHWEVLATYMSLSNPCRRFPAEFGYYDQYWNSVLDQILGRTVRGHPVRRT